MVDINCVLESEYLVNNFSKSTLMDTKKNSSLLIIDDDMEYKDLIVMIIEYFGIQDRYISLNKVCMSTIKTMVKDFVSLENNRQLRTFINIYKVA